MKTVYIHIGTFKTGTTSIQRFLKDNRERLDERGIYVPTTELLAHHPLPLSLIQEHSPWRAGWRGFKGGADEVWGRLINEIEQTDCEKILISSESFCDLVNENCREKSQVFAAYIKNRLQAYDVKIICYLRSIEPYLKSIYQESIKITPRTIGIAEEIGDLFKRDSIHTKPSIYLDFYAKIFGRESILVKEYSKEKLLDGDTVKDFLDIFGCADLYDIGKKIHNNPSLSARQVSYKRALNACYPESYELHQELAQLIYLSKEISGGSEYKNTISRERIEDINCEQKRLADQYGIQLTPAGLGQSEGEENSAESDYNLLILSLLSKIIAQNELLLSRQEKTDISYSSRLKRKIQSSIAHLTGKKDSR